MSRRVLLALMIVAAGVIAMPSWAKDSTPSLHTTILLASTANVGKTALTPGDYQVTAEGNDVKFERGGKLMAESTCTWKTLPNKASQTEVIRDGKNNVAEIQVSGKTQAIEFSSSGNAGN